MSINSQLNSVSECVSAQVFPPIYVPIICGNDVYLVAQQDIRHIIDSRHISSVKCLNGLEDLQRFYAQNVLNNPQFASPTLSCAEQFEKYMEYMDFVKRAMNLVQCQNLQNGCGEIRAAPCPFPTSDNFVAPIQTQLDWEMKDASAEKPKQFVYGKQTSTTDLADFRSKRETCNLQPIIKILLAKGTNTSPSEVLYEIERQIIISDSPPIKTAQEQLKEKKAALQLF